MQNKIAEIPVVRCLLLSNNPSIVYKTRVYLLEESPDSAHIRALAGQIKSSSNARRLLSHRLPDGTIHTNPYRKWQGPHWTLFSLAQIEYPPGDESLIPLRDQVYAWMLAPEHLEFPRSLIIPGQEQRVRRCASQEGNAIWYSLKLGLVDERTELLVDRLVKFQWPDGGWNCDKRPEARTSSFIESLIPARALAIYGREYGDSAAQAVAERTAEFLLKRQLYRRLSDGCVIKPAFTRIQYPIQFYDILFALVVMVEMGKIDDPRCDSALDLLLSKHLPGGGFPLEEKNCKATDLITTRGSFADWGPSGKRRMNEFVSVDGLYVLKAAGRL
ncbi:MAG: hypothetical protein MUO76_02020 [Anaerolineaceae bacterium]|nr:hypothetical protein [Anaerolineaceae bacterium]